MIRLLLQKSAVAYTKDTIIRMLRGYIYNKENYERLIHHPLYQNKINVEDLHSIKVYDGTPDVLTDFPMAVLSGGTGDIQSAGLADFKQEQYNEFNEVVGYVYGGTYTLNFTLELATLSSFQDECITDFLVHALRVYLYRKLEAAHILLQSVKYEGTKTINDKNNIIFVSNIGITTWTQWSEYVDLLDLQAINLDIKTEGN